MSPDMEKDFTFYPSVNSSLRCLGSEEVETFNQEGYLKGIRIFGEDRVLANRDYFDRLLAMVLAKGKNSYSIGGAHVVYGGVHDLSTSPEILDLAEDILGPNFVGVGAHYFCKLPWDRKVVSWHQDFSYWPLNVAKVITIWLAIDDVDRGNACMQVVPESHHHGHLPFRESDPQENNVLNQTVDQVEQYGTPDCIELRAGEVSVHSSLLLHGSDANNSDRRRCGIALRYATVDVRGDASWQVKGVLCRGSDPDSWWADVPRPELDP